jgi:transposase
MAGRKLPPVVLTESERAELESLSRRQKTAQAIALRARIVLAASTRARTEDIAVRLNVCAATVRKWHRRFVVKRVDGLHDERRPGTPRTITDNRIEAVIVKTLESTPAGATHWSSRSMARASGVSVSSVQRIWRAFGLQPHRSETFKLSTDPLFLEKVHDVVGLYVAPPAHAIVLCVDEKSQSRRSIATSRCCQCVLDRSNVAPMIKTRHGVTSLFAALDIASGRVIGKCYPRHRSVEFRRFLDRVEAAMPSDLDVHVVMDNYATHQTAR